MTHEYTLLLGATVLPGGERPACGALAWAEGTILALGSAEDVRAISRGASHVMTLPGRYVAPLDAPLEVGGPADMVVLATDPRVRHAGTHPGAGSSRAVLAVVRGGHVVEGSVEAQRGGPPASG